MIDFRYHLVSLISVFLALAIGVVLGAGPLRDTLGATLEEQVGALRDDKGALQQAVANRDALLDQRDAFVETLSPALLRGALTDTDVALVILPEVDADTSAATAEALVAAGASVSVTATVSTTWLDAGSEKARVDAAGSLAGYLGAAQSASEPPEAVLADLLALAVLPETASADAAEAVREGLADAGLAEVAVAEGAVGPDGAGAGPLPRPTRSVMVLAPAPPPAETASDTAQDGESADRATAGDGGWLPLLASLRGRSAGAVLAGPLAAGEGEGLLAQVRAADDGAGVDGVSTVDGVDDVVGRVTAVLALREQLDGGVGSYGSSATAEAAAPPSSDAP